ncbi:MAG: ABC transporter permease [Candidatus Bipolaricaulota bacterium]|nr:ABC transporter permease [Candidatus Bipolaricaulota bacterium]
MAAEESKIEKFISKTRSFFLKFHVQFLSVILAFIVCSLILLIVGYNPISVIVNIFIGSFVGKSNIGSTLVSMTTILLTGLSFLTSIKCGLFNIGMQGQFLMGAFLASLAGFAISLPAPLHIFLSVLAGTLGGVLWILPALLLKIRRDASVLLTTLMLSFIAPFFGLFLVRIPFNNPDTAVADTPYIRPSAELPRILPPSKLNIGFLISLVVAVILYVFLWKTEIGYKIRAVGFDKEASHFMGIDVSKYRGLGFVISGGLAGLAGSMQVLGVWGRFFMTEGRAGFSTAPGWMGIPVGLVGGLHPIGAMFSSLFFGALDSGFMYIDLFTNVPAPFAGVLLGTIVVIISTPLLIKYLGEKISSILGGSKWNSE